MTTEKPPIRVGPMRQESAGASGKILVGPFIELDMRDLTYLDELIGTDQQAAQDFTRDMIAALEDDIEGKDSSLA